MRNSNESSFDSFDFFMVAPDGLSVYLMSQKSSESHENVVFNFVELSARAAKHGCDIVVKRGNELVLAS